MAMVLGTTLSPLIGGVIVTRFGWHTGFWALCAASLLLAAVCARLLPETGRHARRVDSAAGLLRQAHGVLVQPVFFAYMLQTSVIYSVFIVFISVAPYIMVGAYHRPVTDFGLYYMMISVGYFLGNLYVSHAAHRIDSDRLTHIGLSLQLAAALAALGFWLAGLRHPLWVFGPMLPLALGQGLALPNINARAVMLAPGYAGIASSLIGFSQQAVAGVGVQAMGWAPTNSALPILVFCAAVSALAFLPALAARGLNPASSVPGSRPPAR
jgi:DHA1 family bicyclomycin/chloramphenicol resistance-like MFS transporter